MLKHRRMAWPTTDLAALTGAPESTVLLHTYSDSRWYGRFGAEEAAI